MEYILFFFGMFVMGFPIFAKMLYVFYWVGTFFISFLVSKIRFSVTKSSKDWSRKKKFSLLFMIFNIPPAAVPVFTFVQWGTMCLAQDDYVVHSTFNTPSEFLGEDGFPKFLNSYGNEFKLPMEGLDLELNNNSRNTDEVVTKSKKIVRISSSGKEVFEYSSVRYRTSRFPLISYIYKEIPSRSCGYGLVTQDRKYYRNIMIKVFTK